MIQEAATAAVLTLAKNFKLSHGVGADHTVRDSPTAYIYRPGQISGTVILAYWKPQCHDVSSMHIVMKHQYLTTVY